MSERQISTECRSRDCERYTENTGAAPTSWRESGTGPADQDFWPDAQQCAGTVLGLWSGCTGYSKSSTALLLYRAPHEEGGQPHLTSRLQTCPGEEGKVICPHWDN